MKTLIKKIGIIGGAGPLASALLLENIVHECYKQGCKNEAEFPEIVLLNNPFSIKLCKERTKDNRPLICDVLQSCVNRLVGDGAMLLAVVCNTFHLFLNEITTGNSRFVSIAQATLESAQQQKLSRLLILGTPLTLRNHLYHHPTIECIAPAEEDHVVIESIINRILAGSVIEEDALLLSFIVAKHQQKHFFDGVVLGCTELPVLHKKYPLKIPGTVMFLDTIEILAQRLVKEAFI